MVAVEPFDVVMYHRNCPDGFTSLLLAYDKGILKSGNAIWFQASGADETKLPAALEANKRVLILDINMRARTVQRILDSVKSVVMIDHHTNQDHDQLVKLQSPNRFMYLFDKNECAATLVWKWLHGDKPIPRFLEYVRDSDLSLSKIPETQAFTLAVEVKFNTYRGLSREAHVEKLERYKALLTDNALIDKLIKRGKVYKEYQNALLSRMDHNFETVEITHPLLNKKIPVLVTNGAVFIARKLGPRLVKKMGNEVFMCIVWYFNVQRQSIECVVRSSSEDITWLLHMYKGGGHRKAGTFFFPVKDIYSWMSHHEEIVRKKLRAP